MTKRSDSADDPTNSSDGNTEEGGTERRDFLKGVSAAAAGGATMLAGCSGDGGDGGGGGGDGGDGGGDGGEPTDKGGTPEKGAVHFISMEQSPKFQEFWDKTGKQFEEEHGTGFDVTYAWETGYTKRIAQLLQAGDPPDIINLEGFNAGQYVTENLLADTTDMVKEFQQKVGFPDQFRIQYNDADRWFPSFVGPDVRWYRGDIMEEIGFEGSSDIGAPDTYEEWGTFMKDASDQTDLEGSTIGTAATFYGTNTMFCHLWAKGVQITRWNDNDEIEIAIGDDRETIGETLQWLKDHYQYSADTGNWSWTESIDAFANGNTAEVFYGGARPQVQAHEREREWSKQVLPGPYPNDPDVENDRNMTFPSGWGIMKGGDKTEAAKKYVSMIMMDDELLNEFYQLVPVHNAPLDKERRDPSHPVWDVELVNESMTEEQLSYYLSQIPAGRPSFQDTDPVNFKISNAFMSFGLGNMAFEFINNDASVDQAVDTAITDMEGAL